MMHPIAIPAFWSDSGIVRNEMLDYALKIQYEESHIDRMLAELERRGLLTIRS